MNVPDERGLKLLPLGVDPRDLHVGGEMNVPDERGLKPECGERVHYHLPLGGETNAPDERGLKRTEAGVRRALVAEARRTPPTRGD
jgi:hypothetical protein